MSSLVVIEAAELERLIDTAVVRAVAKAAPSEQTDVMMLEEAAKLLKRHPKSLAKLIAEEGLPVQYLTPREPRFSRSEVLAWLSARRGPASRSEKP